MYLIFILVQHLFYYRAFWEIVLFKIKISRSISFRISNSENLFKVVKKNGVRDPPPKKIISKNYFFSISILSWVDSRRSACAMGKWAPPLANAILPTQLQSKSILGTLITSPSLSAKTSIQQEEEHSYWPELYKPITISETRCTRWKILMFGLSLAILLS